MIKKFIMLIVYIFVAALFLSLDSCNYSDTVRSTSKLVLPYDSTTLYRFTKRYFILIPGDVATFYGSRICTVFVNGKIDSCVNDSAYLRTTTLKGRVINVKGAPHYVYPQLFQKASKYKDLEENTITRYFEINDTATKQVAYKIDSTKGEYIVPKNLIAMPRILVIGKYGWFDTDSTKIPINNKWPASPMIDHPYPRFEKEIKFSGFSIATRVIALPKLPENAYCINGHDYRNGVSIETYYTIYGEILREGKIVRVDGTVKVTRTYFAYRGVIDVLKETLIQEKLSDGTVKTIKEKLYFARGREGATLYDEKDFP